jgi:hypothetical protein
MVSPLYILEFKTTNTGGMMCLPLSHYAFPSSADCVLQVKNCQIELPYQCPISFNECQLGSSFLLCIVGETGLTMGQMT